MLTQVVGTWDCASVSLTSIFIRKISVDLHHILKIPFISCRTRQEWLHQGYYLFTLIKF